MFALVKQYDKEFNPRPVHELLTDKGRPRKFYHGTNSEFFEFDLEKSGANYGDTSEGLLFFTSKKGAYPDSATDYAREITKKKGGKETVREVYVSIEKPLVLDSRGYYTTQSYFDENHEEIYNRYLSGDYDGIIIHNSDKSADDAVLAIVDNSGQVKSATYSDFSEVWGLFAIGGSVVHLYADELEMTKSASFSTARCSLSIKYRQAEKAVAEMQQLFFENVTTDMICSYLYSTKAYHSGMIKAAPQRNAA